MAYPSFSSGDILTASATSSVSLYRFFLLDNSTLGILDLSRLGW